MLRCRTEGTLKYSVLPWSATGFIKENQDIRGKKIAVFICFSGGGADKAIKKMKKYIGIKEFEAELILVDPKENMKVEDDEKIDEFCQTLE